MWSVCKVLDGCSVSIHVHSESLWVQSQTRATRECSRRTAHSKCWTVQSYFLTPKCFWATFSASAGDALKGLFWSEQRDIPSFGWQGESICSVPILISIALVTPAIGGLFEWRVNPWSGAIWLIWTVLAKAKTSTTHRLKFWNTFLGSGDLKTDVSKISPSFFHDHYGIPSQYIRVAKRLSPLSRCLYSWPENTGKELSLLIVLDHNSC